MSNLGDFFSLVAEEEKKKKEELEAKLEKAKAEKEIIESLGKILCQMAENKPEIESTTEQVTEQVVVEPKLSSSRVKDKSTTKLPRYYIAQESILTNRLTIF